MRFGVRSILLLVAVILFVVWAVGDEADNTVLGLGFACFAAAFLVDELGVGTRLGRR
jgi:hypothetical protein